MRKVLCSHSARAKTISNFQWKIDLQRYSMDFPNTFKLFHKFQSAKPIPDKFEQHISGMDFTKKKKHQILFAYGSLPPIYSEWHSILCLKFTQASAGYVLLCSLLFYNSHIQAGFRNVLSLTWLSQGFFSFFDLTQTWPVPNIIPKLFSP